MEFLFLFKLAIEYFHILFSLSHQQVFQSVGVLPGTPIALSGSSHTSLAGFNGCEPFSASLPDLHNFSVYLGLAGWFDYSWECCSKGRISSGCSSWSGLHKIPSDSGEKRAGSQAEAAPSLFESFILGTPLPQGYLTLQPACIWFLSLTANFFLF